MLWVTTAAVVYLIFSLSLALVVEKETSVGYARPPSPSGATAAALEEPRHIAYAWSSGLIGMAILSAEVFGSLELQFEDPLLGMAGLNTLVEEVRLRIAQSGRSTRGWV
ncbi:MAG: hypothetical protein OXG44_04795 [Gammaproteobacteria bacterium]|nr:hypothetical protein [Gammaproteobacteria bacterium]